MEWSDFFFSSVADGSSFTSLRKTRGQERGGERKGGRGWKEGVLVFFFTEICNCFNVSF